MDELPPSARTLIARARAAEQPPAGAQERVRAAVAVAIAVGAGTTAATAASHASASAKAGWFASSAVKLAVASGVVVALGTTAMWMRARNGPEQKPSAPIMQPQHSITQPTPAPALPTTAQAAPATQAELRAVQVHSLPPIAAHGLEMESHRATAAHPHRAAKPVAPEARLGSSLHEEMTLLSQASAALDRGDSSIARKLLGNHSQRYRHGQLAPERRGLQVLEACLAGRAAAVGGARAFLRSSPDAVLAMRIAGACKLEQEP